MSLSGLPDCHEVGGFPPSQLCPSQPQKSETGSHILHGSGTRLLQALNLHAVTAGVPGRASQDLTTVLGAYLSPLVAARALRTDDHQEEKAGYKVPEAAKTDHRRSESGQHGNNAVQLQMPEPGVRHQQGPCRAPSEDARLQSRIPSKEWCHPQ